ncbi:MAG: flagellin [Caulobacteraceae bacterium]|nr:flagellin [Caulobacteraceae bacterium]
MIGRVATFVQGAWLMRADMAIQSKLADVQVQESSGRKAETFGGIAGDAAQALDVQGQVSRLTADSKNANAAMNQLQAAYSTVGDMASLATTIESQLASMMSVAGGATDVASRQQQATNWLADLAAMANQTSGGVHLFSGQATDAPAVDLSSPGYDPTPAPATPDTTYFKGSTTPLSYVGSDGRRVTLAPTADAPAFEQLFRAVSLFAAAPTTTATLQQAYDLVGQSVAGLGLMQQTLSASTTSLNDLVTQNSAKIDALNKIGADLTGADLSQAAVLVSQYQTQIEALYSTIAKLSSLSLTKYL